ncbi:MAG: serine hydrolase domain-containing protein [Flavobacteriaceae bacterium]
MAARAIIVKSIFLLLGISILSIGCRNNASGQYKYTTPAHLNDGFTTGSLHQTTLDTALIFKAIKKIKSAKYKEVHSMLIFKDQKLVLEEYFAGHDFNWEQPKFWGDVVQWDRNRLHVIMSDTKSITSALIGIAIESGFIKSVQESIFTYLPDYQQYENQGREAITIEHLLTMTSGLEGNEWTSSYRNLENPIVRLWLCDDAIACILENRMVAKPGTYFSYWGGNQILLGEILKNASGMNVHDFARKYLFEPLGIENFEWGQINDGPYEAAGGLKLNSRAMAKMGITFLNNGRWEEKQIVPESWVDKSSKSYKGNLQIKVPGENSWRHGYSYSWWTKSFEEAGINMFFAGGWGGQNIMVIPEANMVVVFTGGNYTKIPPPKKIMDKYIIPALR